MVLCVFLDLCYLIISIVPLLGRKQRPHQHLKLRKSELGIEISARKVHSYSILPQIVRPQAGEIVQLMPLLVMVFVEVQSSKFEIFLGTLRWLM